MSDFETPLMRDISKLILPVVVGLIIAVVIMFSIMPLNSMYHSLQWELEQFDKGFTWADKQSNGCFERDGGVTYMDNPMNITKSPQMVTVNKSCSSNAMPWETMVWAIPLIIGLAVLNNWLYRKRQKYSSVKESKN